ncbi:MAG TPA: tryptophan--tRNA ligase [Candidatus Acidoferrales bacterium]|nr:tryptophan--tRNA ligase [Candidatus Acidoferrales bacterium]
MAKRKRVLSGMRPTGRLHLGHYFGALSNWLKLQEEYECFFFVADWHALTTHYEDTSSVAENTLQVALDWLAVGLDPEKSTLFIQSSVLDHAELHVLLSMITPLSWLERVPTYKEQIENLKDRDLGTYGFLGYPLLQAADIVMYGEPKLDLLVPVGEDQAPHVELTREVVRRFNTHFGLQIDRAKMTADEHADAATALYTRLVVRPEGSHWESAPGVRQVAELEVALRKYIGEIGADNFLRENRKTKAFIHKRDVLREPSYVATETPRLPGTDGRRMAKSYGNAIWLSDPPDEIRAKVRNMLTDPQRVRRTDPGRPEICPVFSWHKLFSAPETIAKVDQDCRSAALGCVDCKKLMAENLVTWIEPVQARRKEFEAHPEKVWSILDAGSKKAQKAARRTMKRVREAIFHSDEARKGR